MQKLSIILFLAVLLLLLGLVPHSPLSFLKTWTDPAKLHLSQSPASQVSAQLTSAKNSIEEVGVLATGGDKNKDKIESKLTAYAKYIDQAVSLAKDDVSLKVKIVEDLAMHLGLLQDAYKKAADAPTREAIARALEKTNNRPYKILVTLDAASRNQVQAKTLPKQFEAFAFLRKEATGSALPPEYAKSLKKRVFPPPPTKSIR